MVKSWIVLTYTWIDKNGRRVETSLDSMLSKLFRCLSNCWVCWEAVGKGDFKYLSIGLKVKFFYRRIFRPWISIFLSHDFVFSTLASSSSNPTHYAIAQFMIFSILCTIQYRIHWMLTLILPLSVKRSKRFGKIGLCSADRHIQWTALGVFAIKASTL